TVTVLASRCPPAETPYPATFRGSTCNSPACALTHWNALQTSESESIGLVSPRARRYSMEIDTRPAPANLRADASIQSAAPSLQPPPWNRRMAPESPGAGAGSNTYA